MNEGDIARAPLPQADGQRRLSWEESERSYPRAANAGWPIPADISFRQHSRV